MTDVNKLTLTEIKQLGIEALTSVLGPAGMGLFMHQFEMGNGDYTQDRDKILGNPSIREICDRIKLRRQQTDTFAPSSKFTNQKYIDVTKLNTEQIRKMGIEALTKELGSAGMARFMQQFELGSSDYTRDRDEILGNSTIEEIVAEIKQMRQQQDNPSN
jgi:hypothetical protein